MTLVLFPILRFCIISSYGLFLPAAAVKGLELPWLLRERVATHILDVDRRGMSLTCSDTDFHAKSAGVGSLSSSTPVSSNSRGQCLLALLSQVCTMPMLGISETRNEVVVVPQARRLEHEYGKCQIPHKYLALEP